MFTNTSMGYSTVMVSKFLMGPTYQTKVGTSFSDIAVLISEVVQGSGIVVLIVWTIGQVLVLYAAFLCFSDWLMLLLHTVLLQPA